MCAGRQVLKIKLTLLKQICLDKFYQARMRGVQTLSKMSELAVSIELVYFEFPKIWFEYNKPNFLAKFTSY